MGCDIHFYLEVEDVEKNFVEGHGRLSMHRDYSMFSLLADVRSQLGDAPVFEPRGIPKNLSYVASWDYHLYIAEKEGEDDEHSCSRKNAELWVASGSSKYKEDDSNRITHPDWHTPSYLYTDELKQVIKRYRKEAKKNGYYGKPIGYMAALAFMKEIDKQSGGNQKARCVFWFDN